MIYIQTTDKIHTDDGQTTLRESLYLNEKTPILADFKKKPISILLLL